MAVTGSMQQLEDYVVVTEYVATFQQGSHIPINFTKLPHMAPTG